MCICIWFQWSHWLSQNNFGRWSLNIIRRLMARALCFSADFQRLLKFGGIQQRLRGLSQFLRMFGYLVSLRTYHSSSSPVSTAPSATNQCLFPGVVSKPVHSAVGEVWPMLCRVKTKCHFLSLKVLLIIPKIALADLAHWSDENSQVLLHLACRQIRVTNLILDSLIVVPKM